jgi:hypothetical protein
MKLMQTLREMKRSVIDLKKKAITTKVILLFLGLLSTIWFLIRVIPKPSRAVYPCMRASAPLASTFILYLIGITGSMFLFKKARERFRQAKYALTIVLLVSGVIVGIAVSIKFSKPVNANLVTKLEVAEPPIGEAKGINPGRVVWVHNANATNENYDPSSGIYWSNDANTNQTVVNTMFSQSIQSVAGKTSDTAAWNAIFHDFNKTHNRGDVGYKAGEKIVIKINFNGAGNGPANINTSPQICYALLNQLINTVGVAQADISIGDPNIKFTVETYNKCHKAFPSVKYWGYSTVNLSTTQPFQTSDGQVEAYLPQAYLDATYMFNMPVLKKHHRAGISLCSKNHFGSLTPDLGSAFSVHYSLPCPDATGEAVNGDYGVYRIFVDFMGFKHLGAKTVLYIIDGIWSSVNWGHPPIKWRMTPFNNDWPSSIFMSQDPVAIESVGFDFLFNEFDPNHPTEGIPATTDKGPFPRFAGTDDFLHQAADTTKWPDDIRYAPNGDGVHLKSMGTHEHWNNAVDKKYSRNLGAGKGIELYLVEGATAVPGNITSGCFSIKSNTPNPFKQLTTIIYYLPAPASVKLEIYSISGQLITTLVNKNMPAGEHQAIWNIANHFGSSAVSGVYMCKLQASNNKGSYEVSHTMQLIK